MELVETSRFRQVTRKKVATTIYLNANQAQALDELRIKHQINTAEFIRQAIDEQLKHVCNFIHLESYSEPKKASRG